MRTRPVGRPVAAGEPASFVSRFERPAPWRRGHSRRPPDVHHHRVGQQHAGDRAVAREALHRLARDRQPELEVRRRHPNFAFERFERGRHRDVRPDPVAPGQRALVHRVMNQLGVGVVHPLRTRPIVLRPSPLGQRFQRRLPGSTTLGVDSAVDGVHPVRHHADVQTAALVVSLRLFEEAVGVSGMLGSGTKLAQAENRVVASVTEHLFLVEELSLVTEPLAQMTEQGR